MEDKRFYTIKTQGGTNSISLIGDWTIRNAGELTQSFQSLLSQLNKTKTIHLDPKDISRLDTAGAWILLDWLSQLQKRKFDVSLEKLPTTHELIFKRVQEASKSKLPPAPAKTSSIVGLVVNSGKAVVGMANQLSALTLFMGQTVITFFAGIFRPKEWRIPDLFRHIEETGINAIPIIAMMSFMISIVIAYQGAYQLRQYGAEIYTIDLTAISVLREMGVLITSIMVAGRSGSAFAAEIGVMKVNEEVDALRTLGMSPFSVLVVPRMIALIITLPLLTFFADMMGLLGAAFLMSMSMGISFSQFTGHLNEAIKVSTYFVGLIKAPFFAMIIALVGCLRGMQVTSSAESVGKMTTKAVVESIFLVMLADALFSILFTQMNV